ncbi:cation diffusion facilitator family transporter [Aureivirga sp. CE67]|uniref:cation diffusion facilitator family transporter n=1 Tax=Aureivirga sp. CE67 TaxID=1788983 RepID=UPI0018C97AEE|nr:cation diffusion facilitator family transporter [Aureivirga sp. CE67]
MLNKAQIAIKTIYISIIGNFLLAVVKAISGIYGNSYALVADSLESCVDVFASIIALIALKYATKPPDDNHPYGHGKIEPIITFLTVLFLVSTATVIAHQSIINIQEPHEAPKPFTLIVLAIIIIGKEIFYRILNKKGNETDSSILKAEAWHHRADSMTSGAAFIGILIAVIFGKEYAAADDWAALFASIIIYYNSFLIFRPALGEIMDENLYEELIEKIRKIAKENPRVVDTEKCFVRKTGMYYFVDLHLIVCGDITVKEGHEIAHEVKELIIKKEKDIIDVLIHIEPD